MRKDIKIGTLIKATYEKAGPAFEGFQDFFKVVDMNVKNDCHGTIQLTYIGMLKPDGSYQKTGNTSIVEEKWFSDEEITNRKIEVIKKLPTALTKK